MRRLLAVALASGVFGGAVGAMATAATESSASPQAIAAAVQRVSDTRLTAAVNGLETQLIAALGAKNPAGGSIRDLLSAICKNLTPVSQAPVQCF